MSFKSFARSLFVVVYGAIALTALTVIALEFFIEDPVTLLDKWLPGFASVWEVFHVIGWITAVATIIFSIYSLRRKMKSTQND